MDIPQVLQSFKQYLEQVYKMNILLAPVNLIFLVIVIAIMTICRFTLGRVKTARIFYGIDLSEQECEK